MEADGLVLVAVEKFDVKKDVESAAATLNRRWEHNRHGAALTRRANRRRPRPA
jgi:hypothetical protein